jgi:hypothetical protein
MDTLNNRLKEVLPPSLAEFANQYETADNRFRIKWIKNADLVIAYKNFCKENGFDAPPTRGMAPLLSVVFPAEIYGGNSIYDIKLKGDQ